MTITRSPMTVFTRIRSRLRSPPAPDAIDLAAPAVSLDPFPHYEELRSGGDVHFLSSHGFWIVLGYDAVQSAFEQPQVFSNAPYEEVDAVLLGADPPRHAAVRRIVARQLSPEALDRLRPSAERIAAGLIEPELDVVAGYARPISAGVAAEVIGFDEKCVADILDASVRAASAAKPVEALIEALDGVAHRSPLYGTLLDDGEGALDDAHARSLIRLLWLAGTTTTERMITGCVLELIRDEAVYREVADDRTLLPRFVEEVLRLHPPEHMLRRMTTEAVRLGEVEIPAGADVQLCVTAANRDPAHFEDPSALRLDRAPKRHFAFGGGVHHCVGAAIARRVVAVAVGTLMDSTTQPGALEPLASIPYFHTAAALTPESLRIRM
jgi:cytochrome P450